MTAHKQDQFLPVFTAEIMLPAAQMIADVAFKKHLAGLRGASDPLAYATQLFEDWHSHQIWTMRDLERYLLAERNRA